MATSILILRLFSKYLPLVFALHLVYGLSVIATVDQNNLSLDDVFEYTVEATDASENPQVDISPLSKNFLTISGPSQQTNISWVNGRMTSTRSLSWTLSPKKTGHLYIPALSVKLGKSNLKTNPIKIQVLKKATSYKKEDSPNHFIQVQVDKETAYLGEQITVTYQLFTRTDLSIESVDLPEFVGFWTENLYSPRQINMREVSLSGVRYKKAKLYSVALFPTKTGKLSLAPYTVNAKVFVESNKSRRRDPFFDVFDTFSSRQSVRKVLKSEIKTIHVLDYPKDKPSDFTGAVGSYTIKSSVDVNNVKANEAVTFYIEVSGSGNLSLFSLPDLTFPSTMEVFPPASEIKKDSFRDEITGTMRWEYVIIPRQPGEFNLPRVELPFFNPKTKNWKRAKAHSIQVSVAPGSNLSSSPQGLTKQEVELLGKDIRYHRTEIPKWNQEKDISLIVVVFYFLAACGFIFPGIINSYQHKHLQGAEVRKSKKALQKAIKSIKNLREDEFDLCAGVIYKFLKEKFYLKTDVMDPSTVSRLLESVISSQELNELVELLNRFDAGRYSPQSSGLDGNIISTAIDVMNKIDRHV